MREVADMFRYKNLSLIDEKKTKKNIKKMGVEEIEVEIVEKDDDEDEDEYNEDDDDDDDEEDDDDDNGNDNNEDENNVKNKKKELKLTKPKVIPKAILKTNSSVHVCEPCNFSGRKSDYNRHILTQKHNDNFTLKKNAYFCNYMREYRKKKKEEAIEKKENIAIINK